METALRRIADMLEAFMDAAAAWFATGAWRPEAWPGITWALVAALVVLSWLLAWRRRTPRALDVRPPQLLVTSGEVVPDGADEPALRPSGRRRRRAAPVAHAAAGTYAMTVSNLSRYPVQLLEVALRDGRRGAPRVATVDAVVPAMGSVSVSGRILLGLRGDGWLDLYCYAAAPRFKMHRHRVELVWEPWAARFKAAPLDQVSVPARRLASDEPEARFLEDEAVAVEAVEVVEPETVAAALPAWPAERRDRAPRAPGGAAPIDDRSTAASAIEPPAPAPSAPALAAPGPAASSAAPRPKAAHATPRSAERPASTDHEPHGVPRIATPPVGVAVAGRGGEAGRTAGGLPIGRPTARPEPVPAAAAPEPVLGPASDAPPARPTEPTPTVVVAPTEVANEDDPPRPQPPARRRPRLEFPDEF